MKAKSKVPTLDDIAWTYCGVALAVIWYVLKGSDDVIYLFWAMAFFVHATAQHVIRAVRQEKS